MPLIGDSTAIYIGASAASAVYVGGVKVWPTTPVWTNSYMDCTVGTVTTVDPGVPPAQTIILAKLRGPVTGNKTICAQALNTGNLMSWGLRRGSAQMIYTAYATGTTSGSSRAPAAPAPTQADEYIGIAVDRAVSGQTYTSTNGTSWTAGASAAGVTSTPFDTTVDLKIGTSEYQIGLPIWDSRIYWCEMRTGLSPTGGTVLWRFDANDHVSGTTWTDPRGRTWTLTTAAAITHA
jgi:hypothetical protein